MYTPQAVASSKFALDAAIVEPAPVEPPQDVRHITAANLNQNHRPTVFLHSGTFMTRRGHGEE
jgi:hypothetical protein